MSWSSLSSFFSFGSPAWQDIPGFYIRNNVRTGAPVTDDTSAAKGSFVEQTRAALLKLQSGKNGAGKGVVEGVSKLLISSGLQITIEPAGGFQGQTGSGWDGASRLVRWYAGEGPATDDDDDQLNGIPSFVILGHELVHALHTLWGTEPHTGNFSNDKAVEEAQTIGLGPWADVPETENGIRAEWDFRLRTTFCGATAKQLLTGTKYAKF